MITSSDLVYRFLMRKISAEYLLFLTGLIAQLASNRYLVVDAGIASAYVTAFGRCRPFGFWAGSDRYVGVGDSDAES